MDYEAMLDFHKENRAEVTIAVMPVPMEEASRFGIMITDENRKVVDFEEKPAHPRSNLASMGIYIFNWKDLRKLLISDMKDAESDHDFGKNIIPTMLAENKKLIAYRFEGYWKDVGTIDSLWEANMDLLDEKNELDLSDPTWRIYSKDESSLPAYIGPEAELDRVYLTQGTQVEGMAKNSVLSTLSVIKAGAKVIDTVLMPKAVVEEGATVTRAIVAGGVKIGKGAVVGSADSENIILVSKNVKGVE
jgi:glucose-1-phosphate adenylyltransferase